MIVGDNDVNSRSKFFILSKFLAFKDAIWPTQVKFAGNMRRKDLDQDTVASNNAFFSENLGCHYKSTKLVKRDDFYDYDPCHFDYSGHGYRHFGAMILSVLKEFSEKW